MTEQTEEKPAIDPKLLPEEERDIFEKQLGITHSKEDAALIYGDIKQDDIATANALDFDWFDRMQLKAYRYYAQFDTYNIEMVDGSTIRYDGMFPSAREFDEIEAMRIEIAYQCSIDFKIDEQGKIIAGKRYNGLEIHHLRNLWLDKLAEVYLLNTKTNKPMTHDERLNCKYDHVIKGILMSKIKRSNNDIGPIGKN